MFVDHSSFKIPLKFRLVTLGVISGGFLLLILVCKCQRQEEYTSSPMISKRVLSSLVQSMRFSSSTETQVLKPGTILRQTRVFTNSDIIDYSKVSHDSNPLHLDPQCALNAGFQDCLVHGMLVASLFPLIIAARFPGAIYASQSLHFKVPAYVGEEMLGEVEATNIRQIKNKYMVKFSTRCFKNEGLVVLDGEASAILPTLSME